MKTDIYNENNAPVVVGNGNISYAEILNGVTQNTIKDQMIFCMEPIQTN